MKVLLIEDEPLARKRLVDALASAAPSADVVGELDSVSATKRWFAEHAPPDLVISDIELTDGNVFLALEQVRFDCPIIFVTAYDQFLLRAFEENGIAYLLKPVQDADFADALAKYERLRRAFSPVTTDLVEQLRETLTKPRHAARLIVKRRGGIHLLPTSSIAYIRTQDEMTSAVDRDGQEHPLRENLKQLEAVLDPAKFFRINRSEIVHIDAIERLDPLGPERLEIRLENLEERLRSSTGRTPALRRWLRG